jgi:hypothetical protein
VARAILIVMVSIGAPLALWGFWWEPDQLAVRRVTLALPGWPVGHEPLTVAVMSDLHAGSPYIDAAKIVRVVESVNAAGPDLVLLLGDYVIQVVLGGTRMEPAEIGKLLAGLEAPLGVYAVLGNHDWWDGVEAIRGALTEAGAAVIDNQAHRIDRPEGDFWLLGIGDVREGRPKIDETLAAIQDSLPVIAFTHNPDLFPAIPVRVTLTLAGHTHGGQVVIPLVGRPVVPSEFGERFAYGHIVEDNRHLYVTGGLGTSILPVRFRVPPEVVLLTIQSAP